MCERTRTEGEGVAEGMTEMWGFEISSCSNYGGTGRDRTTKARNCKVEVDRGWSRACNHTHDLFHSPGLSNLNLTFRTPSPSRRDRQLLLHPNPLTSPQLLHPPSRPRIHLMRPLRSL